MRSVQERLQALELRCRRDPLMLLCVDGAVRTAREAIACNAGWCRVVAGSDLDALDLLLDELKRRAEADTRRCGDD